MIQFISSIILLSVFLPASIGSLVFSRTPVLPEVTTAVKAVPANLDVITTAREGRVVDNDTGLLLWDKKTATSSVPIASITKLMTAMVVVRSQPDWQRIVTVQDSDMKEGGLVNIVAGDEVSVEDLFHLMLISSTNEAAYALARVTDEEGFVDRMNALAVELQLSDTHFTDPSGLDPTNVSSPRDLVKLAEAAFSYPEITNAVLHDTYDTQIRNTEREVRARSTDQLLTSFINTGAYRIIGAKTGYLDEAGYCFVAVVEKDGHRVTVVLLGSATKDDRWQEAKGLIDWTFRTYTWPLVPTPFKLKE